MNTKTKIALIAAGVVAGSAVIFTAYRKVMSLIGPSSNEDTIVIDPKKEACCEKNNGDTQCCEHSRCEHSRCEHSCERAKYE